MDVVSNSSKYWSCKNGMYGYVPICCVQGGRVRSWDCRPLSCSEAVPAKESVVWEVDGGRDVTLKIPLRRVRFKRSMITRC